MTADETPDARPGISVLFFTMDTDSLGKRLTERIGQTVLTCPTTSCFDGLPDLPDRLPAGRAIRVFGDRFQISKVVGGQRYWRVPVMEGEFLLSESFGVQKKGVGGGNFLILGEDADAALAAAEAAVEAIDGTPDVILPFPGGRRAQRQQGGRPPLQGHDCIDQRRVLPDAQAADAARRCRMVSTRSSKSCSMA